MKDCIIFRCNKQGIIMKNNISSIATRLLVFAGVFLAIYEYAGPPSTQYITLLIVCILCISQVVAVCVDAKKSKQPIKKLSLLLSACYLIAWCIVLLTNKDLYAWAGLAIFPACCYGTYVSWQKSADWEDVINVIVYSTFATMGLFLAAI